MLRDRRLALARRQSDPQRDAELTEQFHRWLRALRAPRRKAQGVKWNPITHPIDWSGWPIVRVDVRMLR